jgi:dihydrofolate synthase/folylpolyglutamate synthase
MNDEFRRVDAELMRRGYTRMVFDLGRIEALLDMLGNPQRAYPSVHLTGTNGKTSTARMIDSLLRAHGLRVGRYTSPHMSSVRERLSIEGEPVSEERFVDVGVIEVGLGGVDDSTNVIQARTCVITPIGLDHTEWLGDTLEDIALAKVGIVHKGATLICAAQPDEAMEPILRHCAEVEATIAREGTEFAVLARSLAVGGQMLALQGLSGVYEGIYLPLHGAHQAQNAAVALATVEAFLGAGDARALDASVVQEGFADVTSPGRLERVRSAPTLLLDAAHNPAGMKALVTALVDEFDFRRLIAVVAALGDKDVRGMLDLLEPAVDAVVVTKNTSPRAMPVTELNDLAVDLFGEDRVRAVSNLPDAIELAVALAEEDLELGLGGVGVLVTGSVVTVADARKLLVR